MQAFFKTTALIVFSFMMFGFYASGQVQEDGEGAKIKFEEKSHDFGKLEQGDIVDHVFKFKNAGGPLDDKQLSSVVEYIRSLEK